MGKGAIIVAGLSITTIVLFVVMLYLMSTVNPPQKFGKDNRKYLHDEPTSSEHPDESIRRSDSTSFDDAGVLPIVDTAQYGLEKVDTDVIDFYRSTKKPSLKYPSKDRKVIPPLWPRSSQEIIINPTMHKVMPPIWPTKTVIINAILASTIKPEQPLNTTKISTTTVPTTPSIKSVKRRSVSSNYILDEDERSVILKILDNNEQPKIEIKIWGDDFLYKSDEIMSGLRDLQNKSNVIIKSNIFFENETAESSKNTVVTLCANDSVVVEELLDTNVTDLVNSFPLSSIINDTDGNINTGSETSVLNNTTGEVEPSSEKLLMNTTKILEDACDIFKNKLSNNDTNIVAGGLYNASGKSVKNSSLVVDAFFNAKTNNTEFNKRIFSEEVDVVFSDTTSGQSADNDKISISDIYPNNFTDLFIENDSYLVF